MCVCVRALSLWSILILFFANQFDGSVRADGASAHYLLKHMNEASARVATKSGPSVCVDKKNAIALNAPFRFYLLATSTSSAARPCSKPLSVSAAWSVSSMNRTRHKYDRLSVYVLLSLKAALS